MKIIKSSIRITLGVVLGICLIKCSVLKINDSAKFNTPIQDLANYTLPLVDEYDSRYCSSVSVSYHGKYYTLTNKHCCEVTSGTKLFVGDNQESILFISSKHDVCIATSKIKSPITLAEKEFNYLEKVLVLGYPKGGQLTPRFGYVIELNKRVAVNYAEGPTTQPSNIVSTLIFGGNSGSPVFNSKGQVVNLIYAGPYLEYMSYGATVPLVYIKEAFTDMEKHLENGS